MANNEPNQEPKLSGLLDVLEHAVCYGASALLAITLGMLFVSTGISMLQVLEVGLTQTGRTVLDQVLLILIGSLVGVPSARTPPLQRAAIFYRPVPLLPHNAYMHNPRGAGVAQEHNG